MSEKNKTWLTWGFIAALTAAVLIFQSDVIGSAWFVTVIVALMLGALFMELLPPEQTLITALLFIMLGSWVGPVQFLDPERGFKGFASSSLITIGALFIVAQGAVNTGLFDQISSRLLGKKASVERAFMRLSPAVVGLSAFFNNTPIVALFMPNLREWASRHRISPSKLLLPLSYLAIFGGVMTLIGTSTNLVVDGLCRQSLGYGLSFFGFAWIGLPCAILGVAYLRLIGLKMLPDRRDLLDSAGDHVKNYLVEMEVEANGGLEGKSIEAAGFRSIDGLFLFEVKRSDRVFTPVKKEFVLQAGDVLVFSGERDRVIELRRIRGLSAPRDCERLEIGDNAQLVEVVISPGSPLVGRTIDDLWFNRRYDAAVLALHRHGTEIVSSISMIPLAPGDTLLLVAGIGFRRMWQNSADFYLISPLRHEVFRPKKAPLVALTIAAVIAVAASNILPVSVAVMLAALFIIITRCVPAKSAFGHVDFGVLMAVGAALGIGDAIASSGAAASLAELPVSLAGGASPWVSLLVLYIFANCITELVTNNAAAALVFPIAVKTAENLDVSPMPFIMAIAIAASASFSTPIGYQTNLMVYGPGGYRFTDYVKVGLPLNLIFAAGATLIAPLVWPF